MLLKPGNLCLPADKDEVDSEVVNVSFSERINLPLRYMQNIFQVFKF
jgi:hypothetical protein